MGILVYVSYIILYIQLHFNLRVDLWNVFVEYRISSLPSNSCCPRIVATQSEALERNKHRPRIIAVASKCSACAHVLTHGYCMHGAIHLPSMNWTYGDAGFYSGQISYLNMKVLTFAKNENMQFF